MSVTRPHLHELLTERGTTTNDLVCWGGTDNADMCFLIPHTDPHQWAALTVIGRGSEYDLWEGQADSYLLYVLRGDYISDVFPDDFPDENPSYERNPFICPSPGTHRQPLSARGPAMSPGHRRLCIPPSLPGLSGAGA